MIRQDFIALYVHWPYCSRICPYCDFNVTRDRGQASQRSLFDSILSDLKSQSALLGPRTLVSLFFGGGTPSLLPPDWTAELIATAKQLFPSTDDIEITLEANPTDAEIARYRAFRDAGINRLSLGVQSLDDEALKFLGRNHSAREAITGIETAQSVFGRVSLDLIYARPEQTTHDWREELTRAAALSIEHISPYQLTIEQTTAFGRAVRRGRWSPPDQDLAEAFYFETQDTLERLNFDAYEVSNHARGINAQAMHNVHIWRGVDYIGVGPGAHGRLTIDGQRHATTALSELKAYTARVADIGVGHESETLTPLEAEEEAAMLGLRMAEGVALSRFKLLDLPVKAAPLIDGGFMELTPTHLRATPKGRVLLDRLLMELLS
ncbi:radical SAM superfamily protein [Asticcacaulis biprosthecium C19]|uniref:Heme chaperone HemW n=1 Tax=Asticcacaulis biprosthecium C19 TaxID=715226 RepID=F4QK42_9CAUL|nr:radical SAM family heme chaperone HemW [Asticcacaulis biprosthecium]EGF92069.1 radical SAM superfamily protein [Asticcacaulis biprosthecium C19]